MQVLGFTSVPGAGDRFIVAHEDRVVAQRAVGKAVLGRIVAAEAEFRAARFACQRPRAADAGRCGADRIHPGRGQGACVRTCAPRSPVHSFTRSSSSTKYYDTASRAPDALLRLGQSLAAIRQKEMACASFAEVSRKYPNSSAGVKQSVEREQKRVRC